jgi:hypothetical protein
MLMSCAHILRAQQWNRQIVALPAGMTAQGDFRAPIGPEEAVRFRSILAGQVVLRSVDLSEDEMTSLSRGIEPGIARMFADGGWKNPFSNLAPAQVWLSSDENESYSRVFVGSPVGGPARVEIGAAGQTIPAVVEEAVRCLAFVVLRGEAPEAPEPMVKALARAISLSDGLTEPDAAEFAELGASPQSSLADSGAEVVAGLWLRDLGSTAPQSFLHAAWVRAIAGSSPSLNDFAGSFAEATGDSAAAVLERTLERVYSANHVDGDLARLSDSDLAAGALNAAAPGRLAWRFYTYTPDAPGGYSAAWPDDGADAFAVLHYEDALPEDLIEFRSGEHKILPLSGVSRIDWIVVGNGDPRALAAPVSMSLSREYPFVGLSAAAALDPKDGARLEWSTASHRDIAGWVIFRHEVDESGRVVDSAPEWLPAETESPVSSAYVYVDPAARGDRFYRYDVWAVTDSGGLSRSFRATVHGR